MKDIEYLTVEDLAKMWKVSDRTIRKYIENGLLTPCKLPIGIIRFHPAYIAEFDSPEIKKHSEFEFRTLERENAKLRKEKEELQNIIRELQVISAKSLTLLA
ncbi:helix-turn-helix domain-containing protein [Clostridium neonatale]|uniref:helix-turn-helix domain-containing protein n=1 Tax=Clostridium neonatale TaxID=137838 RepID=UPI00291C10CF|nr:helix-turn-helix domain-containing protein [Clostridium neonatale]CAI3673604.1 Helix-turn-helix domain [Clostridium neonatale]CAI3675144.1 Helix-turn-helix domain [Clostridium neonatale]